MPFCIAVAPLCTFIFSLVCWSVIPFGYGNAIADDQILSSGVFTTFLAVSSLGDHGVLISGWSCN